MTTKSNTTEVREDQDEKLAIKQRVHEGAVAKQQEVVDDLRSAIDQRRQSVDNPDNDDIDFHDLFESTKEEVHIQIEHFLDQLDVAQRELDLLKKIRTDVLHDKVTIGTVVETDNFIFYVAIGVGEFDVDGRELYGISTKAPIYRIMEGKKVGDTFSFRDFSYTIQDVY